MPLKVKIFVTALLTLLVMSCRQNSIEKNCNTCEISFKNCYVFNYKNVKDTRHCTFTFVSHDKSDSVGICYDRMGTASIDSIQKLILMYAALGGPVHVSDSMSFSLNELNYKMIAIQPNQSNIKFYVAYATKNKKIIIAHFINTSQWKVASQKFRYFLNHVEICTTQPKDH